MLCRCENNKKMKIGMWISRRRRDFSVSNFQNYCWIAIDIEVNSISTPVSVVDLAAQRMCGWERSGPPFRRLLNQTGAARVEGYTPAILKRDGKPALEVYRDFAAMPMGFLLFRIISPMISIESCGRNGAGSGSKRSEPRGSAL